MLTQVWVCFAVLLRTARSSVRRLLSRLALILVLGSALRWSSGSPRSQAFLFLLAAIAVLLRSSYLDFRDRPYRRSLSLAVVLLSISGFLALLAWITPGLQYTRPLISRIVRAIP